jgi:hypothetical protein
MVDVKNKSQLLNYKNFNQKLDEHLTKKGIIPYTCHQIMYKNHVCH